MVQKRRKEADEVLRKANTALNRAQNKQKTELMAEGVSDRVAERERRAYIRQHQALGAMIPPLIWIPVCDC
jgi:homoserine kinase